MYGRTFMLYLRVTITNNFVTARHTSAKFCTQTRVVRGLDMG